MKRFFFRPLHPSACLGPVDSQPPSRPVDEENDRDGLGYWSDERSRVLWTYGFAGDSTFCWSEACLPSEHPRFQRPISAIYDFLTFTVLLWMFHAATNAPLFHTGCFVESLATQTLVVFVIRTAGNPLKSRPSRPLLVAVFAIVAAATALPYTTLGNVMGFTPLPLSLLGAIAFLAVTYLLLVQAVKSWFYRRHALL